MELKVIMMALESLSQKVETLSQENKELRLEINALKRKTNEPVSNQVIQSQKEDELVTLLSARTILGLSRSGFLKLVNDGFIKPIRMNLRTVRYSRQLIQEYIAQYR
jgi:regulator of replication initiation timing